MRLLPAIFSVHDVMPHTLDRVVSLLNSELALVETRNILLLIVPGLAWTAEQKEVLIELQKKGYELVGHGWRHKVTHVHRVYHRLHSFFISRNAAEHLSLSRAQLKALLVNNHEWFKRQGMIPPCLYIPPAWAMGRIARKDLRRLPFQSYESTTGLYSVPTRQFKWLPLVGFEADTQFRSFALGLWNRINCSLATERRPVRISIHPYDTELYLAEELRATIARSKAVNWRDTFQTEVTSSSQKKDEPEIC